MDRTMNRGGSAHGVCPLHWESSVFRNSMARITIELMNRLYCLACLLSVFFGTTRHSAAAEEWPRFRGPNGSGESPAAAIPATWTDRDYQWRVKLPGTGHSSPVVWQDRLYVTAASEDDGTQHVCCLRTADGQTVWQRSYPSKTYRKTASTIMPPPRPPSIRIAFTSRGRRRSSTRWRRWIGGRAGGVAERFGAVRGRARVRGLADRRRRSGHRGERSERHETRSSASSVPRARRAGGPFAAARRRPTRRPSSTRPRAADRR